MAKTKVADLPASYSPRLFEVWRKGALGIVKINCGKEQRKATHLRYKLYQLRLALIKTRHPLHESAIRAQIGIQYSPTTQDYWLIVEPANAEIEQLLADNAIHPEDAPDLPTMHDPIELPHEELSDDAYLNPPKSDDGT